MSNQCSILFCISVWTQKLRALRNFYFSSHKDWWFGKRNVPNKRISLTCIYLCCILSLSLKKQYSLVLYISIIIIIITIIIIPSSNELNLMLSYSILQHWFWMKFYSRSKSFLLIRTWFKLMFSLLTFIL